MQRVTRYAKSGDIHVAYQVFGKGPDLVMVPGFVSHIENSWDEPRLARWLNKLGGFCRVVLFDKRGTGLSDRVAHLPHMDERMDDKFDRSSRRTASRGSSSGSPTALSGRLETMTALAPAAALFPWTGELDGDRPRDLFAPGAERVFTGAEAR